MNIEEKSVVAIHYKLTNDAGETLDSSEGREPLKYMHGAQNIIPGLEKALVGKTKGDSLQVTIQPEEGYGPVIEELIQMVPQSAFGDIKDIKAGMQFEAQGPEGQVQLVTVQEVIGEEIKINANHPLAGQVLNFDVTVEEVRVATEEELAHGHPH